MHSEWYKYIYNKIKMKNLPVLLTLYWLSMQIYAIVSLLDGLVTDRLGDFIISCVINIPTFKCLFKCNF